MNQKTFSLVAGIIFSAVTLLHVARLIFGWEVVVGGWQFPMLFSWGGMVIAGFLAYQGIRYGK